MQYPSPISNTQNMRMDKTITATDNICICFSTLAIFELSEETAVVWKPVLNADVDAVEVLDCVDVLDVDDVDDVEIGV